MPVQIYADAAELGLALAEVILAGVKDAQAAGRQYLLGCPSGRSPLSTYLALGRLAGAAGQDMSHVIIVMMDEFVLPAGGGFLLCSPTAHYSCTRFGYEQLLPAVNTHLAYECQLQRESIWLPDPADITLYDAKIRNAGGIDLFIVATGGRDGHVAFNPPGSAADSRSRLVELAETTRYDNMGTFPAFTDISEVPKYGVTVGLATISELSRRVAFIAHGAGKIDSIKRIVVAGAFDPSWPATMIYNCTNVQLMLDEVAAEGLIYPITT